MRPFDRITACLAAGAALFMAAGCPAVAEDTLTVVSWGGAYERAQRHALFIPFEKSHGIAIDIARYNGAMESLVSRGRAEGWDVVDMQEGQAIAACEAGLLRPLDAERIVPADDGGDLAADFDPTRIRDCTIPHTVYATVMAYDDRAYPGVKPDSVDDFFDLARFPGKRAVEKRPDVILEWALLAEGVPPAQVYDLLSTDRGLRLAFRRLDTIRDEIVWWEDAETPAELLRDGKVAMASGYNGRFFALAHSAEREDGEANAPIRVVWDGRVIGYDVWAIPSAADDAEAAQQFLTFATAAERMAKLAEYIPYGPARKSAMERIGFHAETPIPMRDHLPNAPQHGKRALVRDSGWYAHTAGLRGKRFQEWLAAGK